MASTERRAKKTAWQRAWRARNAEQHRADARAWAAANPERKRASDKERYAQLSETERRNRNYARYGITVEDYDRMLTEQGGRCAICPAVLPGGRHGKFFHVDHDHVTLKVRGLLCNKCNTLLGQSEDSIETLESAISYLRRAGK